MATTIHDATMILDKKLLTIDEVPNENDENDEDEDDDDGSPKVIVKKEAYVDDGGQGDSAMAHQCQSMTRSMPGTPVTPISRSRLGSFGSAFDQLISNPSSAARYSYPLLYVSPCGTISVIFRNDIFVEMTVDKTIRVLCPGKFSAATNSRGSTSCIMHPKARVYQSDTHVYCELEGEKLAVFGSQGIIFTMKRLPNSYLVSSTTVKGTTPIRSNCIKYPALKTDFTMNLLYIQSESGERAVPRCHDIVRNAKYKVRDDGTVTVTINGILIKQYRDGDISVHNRPRCIRASPTNNTVSVRTHYVDMGIQENDKAFIKRGVKRIHSSRSGMVVSDGPCITAMDHFGRIVSST